MLYTDLPKVQRVPAYLEEDRETLAIVSAATDEALAARAALEDWIDQLWISTATWGLELWEELVGIPTDLSLSDGERRGAIVSKLCGAGTCNADMISRMAKALTGCDAVTIEHPAEYTFSLQFIGDTPGFAQFDLDVIRAAVEEVKPAHLQFIITGITWADFHLMQMTWLALESQQTTWYDIHNKIMVQPRLN